MCFVVGKNRMFHSYENIWTILCYRFLIILDITKEFLNGCKIRNIHEVECMSWVYVTNDDFRWKISILVVSLFRCCSNDGFHSIFLFLFLFHFFIAVSFIHSVAIYNMLDIRRRFLFLVDHARIISFLFRWKNVQCVVLPCLLRFFSIYRFVEFLQCVFQVFIDADWMCNTIHIFIVVLLKMMMIMICSMY